MHVVVACEFSGIVRDAFRERGHDAVSIDLLPSERPGPHIVGDAIVEVDRLTTWADLLIAHPPCTTLANSGVRWLYGGRGDVRDPVRWAAMEAAAAFMAAFLAMPVARIAVENPVMHRYGQAVVGPPSQVIQPWQHGHGETKATCLWLRGLPPLVPSSVVEGRTPRVHHAAPSPDRWKERSRTMPGIAAAMAEQWGCLPPLPR